MEEFIVTFAAGAPDVPEWFQHTPADGKPAGPQIHQSLRDAHTKAVDRWMKNPSDENTMSINRARDMVQAAEKSAANHDSYLELLAAWKQKDGMARLVQWRFFYARAMVVGLSEWRAHHA
jgi:hypothetical protein